MEQDLVRYSRAGDVFHYRWAARRCLKLLAPGSGVVAIYIEGSKESELEGECSIDLAEYLEDGGIEYFQLKHTTTQKSTPFQFSHLEDTLKRFMARFAGAQEAEVEFHFVSNRPVSKQIKDAIAKIADGRGSESTYLKKIRKITSLDSEGIEKFCKRLNICDTEGDFRQQKRDLRVESAPYFTSSAESIELDSLIALVSERALPVPAGEGPSAITKEDVLSQLQISSEKILFPAPPIFDRIQPLQKREFQEDLEIRILRDDCPLIIRAPGGVGKTVVAQQLAENLHHPHKAVVYDCFGNGSYRSPSEPRHPARVGLVQIANELARDGLCCPLIPRYHDRDNVLFSAFKDRLTQAITTLRQSDHTARLIIIVDAADNSQMAAEEENEDSFAKLLFREDLPEGCKLVAFSRPGERRVGLLEPPASCAYYDLPCFTLAESLIYLRSVFPTASLSEGEEFDKLSQGNPRVQAFALTKETGDVDKLLAWLGPNRTTVEDLIEGQLEAAIIKLRKNCPKVADAQITSVCRCLATLPPCIPKEVLASAAKLDVSDIDSFVADLARPLMISENLVYFRDEPTESWFRETFAANADQIAEMIDQLMPFSETSTYVARALPSLFHQAKKFPQLLAFALSDNGLPRKAGTAEVKAISIQRTQFAFKAALKGDRHLDACKLAFKAAEEMAGTERVDDLFKRHSHFVASCLSPMATQELALSRKISAGWTGSSNIYTAQLLSEQEDFRGQALSFLRSSRQWLRTFGEQQKKKPRHPDEGWDRGPTLGLEELATMARAILNLEGVEPTVDFLIGWSPKECVYEITARLIESLVDSGRIEDARAILNEAREEPHVVIGCCEQMMSACIVPDGDALHYTLQVLSESPESVEMPWMRDIEHQRRQLPLVAFCEAAAANNLDPTKLLKIVGKLCEQTELRHVTYFRPEPRSTFFRAHSLQLILSGQRNFEDSEIWKSICAANDEHSSSRHDRLPRLFGKNLFPWFLRRAQLFVGDQDTRPEATRIHPIPTGQEMSHEGHDAHLIGYEASRVWAEVLGFSKIVREDELTAFQKKLLSKPGERLRIADTVHVARIVYRNVHLSALGDVIEEFFQHFVSVINREPGEETSDDQASFAKAIFPFSKRDAAAHFNRAIEATSKFGYELIERWMAIAAVAARVAFKGNSPANLCQRFFRCAEVVAEGVAREKYWDRCETFAIGLEMNPTVAFAAWSRWRDRRLISYRPTLLSIARRAVDKRILAPATIWPLTGFLECNASAELHSECIKAEQNPSIRATMGAVAVRDLRLAGASDSDFKIISDTIGSIPEWEEVGSFSSGKVRKASRIPELKSDAKPDMFDQHLSALLEQSDIGTKEGLRRAFKGMKQIRPVRYPEKFWAAVANATPRGQRVSFLENLFAINEFDFYALIDLLPSIKHWKNNAAIRDLWPEFLEQMGSRFPERIFSLGSIEYHVESGRISADEFACLQRGVLASFAETSKLHEGSVFLGFVTQFVAKLTPDDAEKLLDFALERMETHVPDDFGEGPLEIGEEKLSPISGLLWSCLGSPYAAERWQAMHTVRRLFLTKNQYEIDHLIERLKSGEVGIYGCAQHDFYIYHARLYLLTALNRAAMDDCELLIGHLDTLQAEALAGPAHLLIQRTAAEICLKILFKYPSLNTQEQVGILTAIGHSPYSLEKSDKCEDFKDAPWESPKTPDKKRDHYFHNDFGWYWFPQLRSLFGVAQHHIEYLAKFFIETSMGKPRESEFVWLRDPRSSSQSNYRSRSQNFQHSHGIYPSADTLDFYCEYHSFLHAAGRLLETTPVIKDDSGWAPEKDPLSSWLQRHLLTLEDGSWLCERRDPAPRHRRKWISGHLDEGWKHSVAEEEFDEILHNSMARENWVVLHGDWTDCNNGSVEVLRVKSALVEPATSDALGRFLMCQESPYDFAFPHCPDDESAGDDPPFVLRGIVLESPEDSIGLSAFDPYAGNLPYPPLEVAPDYADLLDITPDSDGRLWRRSDSELPVMTSEIWNQEGDETHKIYPSGRRIGVEQSLLSELCRKMKMDLIFCVEVHRYHEHDSREYFKEGTEGKKRSSHFRIFILSADGTIRKS